MSLAAERIHFHKRFPDLTEWEGDDLAGRRLLLVHNQGLGDLIQMLRYVSRLHTRGAGEVLLECNPAMIELLRGLPGIAELFSSGSTPRERFDVYARTIVLARLCDEDGTPGRSGVPYITVPPARLDAWTTRFAPRNGERRIGIVWAGNPLHDNDRRRSIPLDAFAPLALVPHIQWFSLQYGPRAGDAAPEGMMLKRFGDDIRDMADTAAIVANLDLVISADTSVAHLAGAMGVPVWLLLPWRPGLALVTLRCRDAVVSLDAAFSRR